MTDVPLYHFTCRHGHEGIQRRSGLIAPAIHPLLLCTVSWFTSLPDPGREKTGLTMHVIRCDRMAYRYKVADVDHDVLRPWALSAERDKNIMKAGVLASIEDGHDPEHWWIADRPVLAELVR